MSEDTTSNAGVESTANDDVLPDWARAQIEKANKQAAKYRTEKNEAVKRAKEAAEAEFFEKQEEFEALLAEKDNSVSKAEDSLMRLRIALDSGVSRDKIQSFADRLQGSDEDELRSDAEELAKLFASDEEKKETKEKVKDPSQGSGNHTPLNGDPLLKAVTSIVNR